MKLTYWVSRRLDDHQCYNIRCKTRRELVEILREADPTVYTKPFKVVVEYRNAFDLLYQCLDEGSIYEHSDDDTSTTPIEE